jgi:hypothetical protein
MNISSKEEVKYQYFHYNPIWDILYSPKMLSNAGLALVL